MKIVILDAATLGDDCDLTCLEELGELTVHQITDSKETSERISDAEVIITNKVVIDQTIIDAACKLKLICVAATGTNIIDLPYAARKNIEVMNVENYSTSSVAQHTFAMLFFLLEHLRYYDEYVRSGKWSKSPIHTNLDAKFFEVKNKRWGIIGLGNIGQAVAEIARAFGAKVCYYSTSGNNNNPHYERLELDELISTCQIISIHAPLNNDTTNLIDLRRLNLLRDEAILLNLGRGGIINENDLSKVIDAKNIFVGLDVLSNEPIRADNPLNFVKHKDRLLITPHIAWASMESRKTLVERMAENIISFYKNHS